MKIEFYNCPEPENFNEVSLPEAPEFTTYKPDFELLDSYRKRFSNFHNLVIIANGGSINPFLGLFFPLRHQATKQVFYVTSQDPDYIHELKSSLNPKDTLVLSISKSGQNTQQLEETFQFLEFPLFVVTEPGSSLHHVAEKLKLETILHPPIGGRYTAMTEVALLPAAICGLDVRGLYEGALNMYALYAKENAAYQAASIFWQLEQQGIMDILMFLYAHNLYPASYPIIQLCHESFGKNGKGQSYFGHEGPEIQHHTTQRFYGGPKNIAGVFMTMEHFLHPTASKFPDGVGDVTMRGHNLSDIDHVPLEVALGFEWSANLQDGRDQGIPLMHQSLEGFSPQEIGRLTAFWQLYAVYGAVLRKVDPFDQPEVENSKNISFNNRLVYNGKQ